jgi:hypothetical protein
MMSAEFYKWLKEMRWDATNKTTQHMMFESWQAGREALKRQQKNPSNSGACAPLLQKADHLARTICKVMRDYTTTVDRMHVLALANDWLDEFHTTPHVPHENVTGFTTKSLDP